MNIFKGFTTKGNWVDMAVDIIIGGALSATVKSLMDDVFI
jgi:large-conductance mechanosensitive channel